MIRDERGSTLPLIIFYAVLALILVLLVTAATALYLERKRLFTLADGAALAGAEAFPLTDLAEGRPQLQGPDVAAAVSGYLASAPSDLTGLAVENADSPDGVSARVTLSSYWRPPVLTVFVPDGLRIEVTATARSVFG
ncbi:pilus assembly protein TadG-related protein [Diaminobutyricimonas sp. TR449]|uniref:pilus assembly protein TadG-related protein n=1 Tax=Diaminobutyricimonas sp. TR449 TaxID=2708076 RepID=UPI0014235A50|nr:pilus assembly protein TadG-related protein [Diaminobutyricimonas sp. TR449]